MHAAGHAMNPLLNNLPTQGRRALREFSSGHGVPSIIYQAYRTQADYLDLVRPLAATAGSALRLPWPRLGQDWPLHRLAGVLETFANRDARRDQAHLDNAKANLGRYKPLLKQGYATGQQVDTQKAQVTQLQNTVKADEAVSMTLTPTMCAYLLKPSSEEKAGRVSRALERALRCDAVKL